jgi:pyroglutamyl-peptidase
MKTRVLITGFEPFHGAKTNPSAKLVEDIKWLKIDPAKVDLSTLLLPVDYKTTWNVLHEKLKTYSPDVCISLGQAGGRESISLERIAINWKQDLGADTGAVGEGSREYEIGKKIYQDGADGIFSSLPLAKMLKVGREIGTKCEITNSAGTFLCNYVFYKTLHQFKFSSRRAGFIHLPLLPEQIKAESPKPSMALDEMKKYLDPIIQAAMER